MLQVKEKDFESFFNVPFNVRGKKSLYASPLKPDLKKMLSIENPVFKSEEDFTFYSVFKDGVAVGRITAHVHRAFNEKYKLNKCYFGFFECSNDQEVADRLLQFAEKWALKRGYASLAGNFNVTAMHEMGIMVSGFENEPYIAQSYGMPYYPELLKNAGYSPSFPMSTFEIDIQAIDPEMVLGVKQKEIFNDPEYEFVPITARSYKKIRPDILSIFNKSFENNALFAPISNEEFDFQAKDLVYFIDSKIAFIVKHKGHPIAVSVHLPDINIFLRESGGKINLLAPYYLLKCILKRERAVCLFAAVLPEYQNKGITGAVSYLSLKAVKERGYKKGGITWISENNIGSLSKVKNMNAKKLHELRIFEKQLVP